MVDFRNDLRCHISGSPAERIYGLILPASKTESKVNQLELAMTIDENIFSLDVTMNNVPTMQIEQSLGDDKNELFCFFLGKAMLGFGKEVVVEGVGTSVLKH